jgi:hypothetical protein
VTWSYATKIEKGEGTARSSEIGGYWIKLSLGLNFSGVNAIPQKFPRK